MGKHFNTGSSPHQQELRSCLGNALAILIGSWLGSCSILLINYNPEIELPEVCLYFGLLFCALAALWIGWVALFEANASKVKTVTASGVLAMIMHGVTSILPLWAAGIGLVVAMLCLTGIARNFAGTGYAESVSPNLQRRIKRRCSREKEEDAYRFIWVNRALTASFALFLLQGLSFLLLAWQLGGPLPAMTLMGLGLFATVMALFAHEAGWYSQALRRKAVRRWRNWWRRWKNR